MHRKRRTFHDHASKSSNRLMPQAHAENRHSPSQTIDDRLACAGLFRRTRSGRNNQMCGRKTLSFIGIDFIVTNNMNGNLRIKLTDPLDQVPSEAVVVVDE